MTVPTLDHVTKDVPPGWICIDDWIIRIGEVYADLYEHVHDTRDDLIFYEFLAPENAAQIAEALRLIGKAREILVSRNAMETHVVDRPAGQPNLDPEGKPYWPQYEYGEKRSADDPPASRTDAVASNSQPPDTLGDSAAETPK